MLLSRLAEYARVSSSVLPPFYESQKVRWVLDLDGDGSPTSGQLVSLANPLDPASKNGVEHVIPSITKSSAVAPKIAIDTPEYLFGWLSQNAKPDWVRRCHKAFCQLTTDWVDADPDGPAQALQAFLSSGAVARVIEPDGWSRGDLVAVRVQGQFLHHTESARRFWANVAAARKASGQTGLCLVCGQVGDLLKTIPQQLPARLVPQASQGASLVSVNKAAHGFALREQLVHTPICVSCGLGSMTALKSLLDNQWRSAFTGQDTRLAWWVTGSAEFDIGVLEDNQPDPGQVARLLGSASRGQRSAGLYDEHLPVFCAVAIGGNVSRVIVRDWIELPLTAIQDSIAAWFADHEMIDTWTGRPRYVGLSRLSLACGRWICGSGSANGSYARFGVPGADRPGGARRALQRSALLGRPLPPKLLAHLVYRVRADGRIDTERASLIRLALRRRPGISHPEAYLPILNPDNHQPAYLAGRIFAVLEDIQLSAAKASGDEAPNVTFADRYFGRAVTSPAVALVAGRRDARAWLKRLRRNKPGWAWAAESRLDDLFNQLAVAGGIPHGAVLADQAAFILGYHQQRADLHAARSANRTGGPRITTDEGVTA
jgi:CRISPR-associated protein Csd1